MFLDAFTEYPSTDVDVVAGFPDISFIDESDFFKSVQMGGVNLHDAYVVGAVFIFV